MKRELPGLRIGAGTEGQGRLEAAEADAGGADLDAAVLLAVEFDVVEDRTPEGGQPFGVLAVEDQLTDTRCHTRQYEAKARFRRY